MSGLALQSSPGSVASPSSCLGRPTWLKEQHSLDRFCGIKGLCADTRQRAVQRRNDGWSACGSERLPQSRSVVQPDLQERPPSKLLRDVRRDRVAQCSAREEQQPMESMRE
jgi:hypothetical protein